MVLDDKEKERFIAYLELSAASCKGMIEQFRKLPDPVSEGWIKKEKIKMAAYLIVAEDLKSRESMTL